MRRALAPAAIAALVALLPFARALLAGECLFFRDASRTFFPIKRFIAEGLRAGQLRFWNPYVHEGSPLHLSPLSYPLDLFHALRPDEAFFTLLLSLHVPLAAAAFVLLARRLGCGGVSAVGGALLYALGGFSLSTLNLYVYTQAMAWAPLLILGLLEAGAGRRRGLVLAAGAGFAAASTSGIEIVIQALCVGAVLSAGPAWRDWARGLLAAALGFALAAPSLFVMRAQLAGSARGTGLPAAVVVSQSIDPWTLPQLVIGSWHGDLGDLANRWWGSNFFPNGFPYILSLYLGAVALCLAALGARFGAGLARRLVVLAALFLVVALGRFVGLGTLLAELPLQIPLRFPVKAFFTVHLGVALLSALGLQALRAPRAWGLLFAMTLGAGGVLVGSAALPTLTPDGVRWFLLGFLPPGYTWPDRVTIGGEILADALTSGWIALAAASVAYAVLRLWLSPTRGCGAMVALLAADLLRTGSALNPTVTPSFYALSGEMARVASEARAAGRRVFSCDLESSPSYFQARRFHLRHDVWSFGIAVESLTPNLNVGLGVPVALSRDLTMMVPESRVLPPEDLSPVGLTRLVDRLRRAGVTRALCLDPVAVDGLRLVDRLLPPRIAPLALLVYEVEGARPLRSLEGADGQLRPVLEESDALAWDVEAAGPARLIVRDAMAPGWRASVNGQVARIENTEGHYRAVAVPEGSSRVEMRYHPPGFAAGVGVAVAAGLALVALLFLAPSSRGN